MKKLSKREQERLENRWDRFAAAALQGLLANEPYPQELVVKDAWGWAERMMGWREIMPILPEEEDDGP